LKRIVLDHQNNAKCMMSNAANYVKRLSLMSNAAKSFDILVISLSILHNYVDSPIKLSSYLFN